MRAARRSRGVGSLAPGFALTTYEVSQSFAFTGDGYGSIVVNRKGIR